MNKRVVANIIIVYCILVNLGLVWWQWFDGVASFDQWAHMIMFHCVALVCACSVHPDMKK